jgi:hypothetical protein
MTEHAEATRTRAETLQAITDEYAGGGINFNAFLASLRDAGATAAEAEDYLRLSAARENQGSSQ